LWRQIKTIGISIIVVYWLASCFTFGVSDFEIFDEGHWVTAKARAEKVAVFTAEHPEAFIMDVWGFGDRTKVNPVIAGADSGVRVWCINSHEVTKTAAEAAQKLCKTTKSGPTTIAIYGGNFANVDFSTNTSGSGSLELTVQQWGKNKYKGLEKMFVGFHTVEFADNAGVPDLSQATSIERVFEYVESIIGDLNKWDVSHIENFSSAFHDSQFNGDISRWNTSRVTNMESMFFQAASFDQNLSQWNISQLKSAYSMFNESGLSPKNFTATLDGWATRRPRQFVHVGARTIHHCGDRQVGLQKLQKAYGWSIPDEGATTDCDPFWIKMVDKNAFQNPVELPTSALFKVNKKLQKSSSECQMYDEKNLVLECAINEAGTHTFWVEDSEARQITTDIHVTEYVDSDD
jgi:bacterial surface protein 26-residue repeat protein